MYTINNIPLTDYGIISGQHSNSNIALAGWLDMPKRIGDTYRDWGDENGVEPYVSADEIYFGGRDLEFKGFIKYDDVDKLDVQLNHFYHFLGSFDDLFEFSTPYGRFNVTVKKEIKTKKIGTTLLEMEITFREPVVSIPNGFFASTFFSPEYFQSNINADAVHYAEYHYSEYGINGMPFKEIGALVISCSDSFNRPKTKTGETVNIETKEAYKITKREQETGKLTLLFCSQIFEDLTKNVNTLHLLLSQEGLKDLNIDKRVIQGYATNGFSVKNIYKTENLSTAIVELELNIITKRFFAGGFFAKGFMN